MTACTPAFSVTTFTSHPQHRELSLLVAHLVVNLVENLVGGCVVVATQVGERD